MEELTKLKLIADKLNIEYAPTIGANTLMTRIESYCNDNNLNFEDIMNISEDTLQELSKSVEDNTNNTDEDIINKIRNTSLEGSVIKLAEDYNKNVRVKITCLHPDKSHLKGETFTAGNAKHYIKKHYLFDKPYYVPKIIVESIKDRTFTRFSSKKNAQGFEVTETKQVPAYSIEYLPEISKEEFEAIRKRQLLDKEGE